MLLSIAGIIGTIIHAASSTHHNATPPSIDNTQLIRPEDNQNNFTPPNADPTNTPSDNNFNNAPTKPNEVLPIQNKDILNAVHIILIVIYASIFSYSLFYILYNHKHKSFYKNLDKLTIYILSGALFAICVIGVTIFTAHKILITNQPNKDTTSSQKDSITIDTSNLATSHNIINNQKSALTIKSGGTYTLTGKKLGNHKTKMGSQRLASQKKRYAPPNSSDYHPEIIHQLAYRQICPIKPILHALMYFHLPPKKMQQTYFLYSMHM